MKRLSKSTVIANFKLQLEELQGYAVRSANGSLYHKDIVRICQLLTDLRKMSKYGFICTNRAFKHIFTDRGAYTGWV